MGNRASSPGINLSEVRQEIIKWKSRPNWIHDDVEIPWTESHLTAVLDYVLKLEGINSSHFTQRNPNQAWYGNFERSDSKKFAEMVESFQQKLRQLFNVPKLQQLSDKDKTLKKNELIAVFIDFLLQLWNHRTGSFEGRVNSLKKELRFLVTILGDTPFLGTELEQVQNLLAEFEAVANLAGSLVYCFNFTTDQQFKSVITKIDKALDALFKRIHLLKANITNLIPSITNAGMTRKTVAVVDSLFIVESLFYDLEDLLNQDNSLIVDVKDQIKMLHQELMFSLSLLKDIKVNRHSEIEELEEPVVRIRDVAYEAEYLINSFLVGDTPLWYFSIRLPHVIDKIKLIGTGLKEIQRNYDIGALKVTKNLSAQLSLQAKRNDEVNDITVGFEDKEKDILDQLIGGADQLQIISIFGMPGLGKTTLARKICNHPSVNDRFDKRSWSVVSQTYQRKNVLINVLISSISELDKDRILNMEEERLAEHLYNEINFPSNIKKLTLDGLRLPWEKMSLIGGLPNLEVLKLKYNAVVGETWDTRDDEFQQLRFLKLEILDLRQWNVATSEHFPKLQQLVFRDCYNLQEIPCEIGEIDTLQSIEVESCLKSLAKSARKIEQEQRDMGNEELKVFIGHIFRDGGYKSNDDDSSDGDD